MEVVRIHVEVEVGKLEEQKVVKTQVYVEVGKLEDEQKVGRQVVTWNEAAEEARQEESGRR